MTKIKNQKKKNINRNFLKRAVLPALIASALVSAGAQAQTASEDCPEIKGTPPGLYATTDSGRTFLIKDDQILELAPGQAAFADESRLFDRSLPQL